MEFIGFFFVTKSRAAVQQHNCYAAARAMQNCYMATCYSFTQSEQFVYLKSRAGV